KEAENVSVVLNQWDFNRKGFGGNRYVYRVQQLERLSLIYLFTGQRELGQFIRGHLLQIAALPMDFWLHAELRGHDSKHPMGDIETSTLCSITSMTLSAATDLFSSAEREK